MNDIELHCIRVSYLAYNFAKYLNLAEREQFALKEAGALHDFGKLYIDRDILFKKETLNRNEIFIIKQHPILGYDVLKNIKIDSNVLRVILEHHERVDGSGYPNGLRNDEIFYMSKIISLCDSFDAMINIRCYKDKLTFIESMLEIENNLNHQFDEFYGLKFISFLKENKSKLIYM
ncbi:hypothetical protein U732_56 [Clostridium argentinense CDC 2741]|uniref:HD-GYP domain-containing protein n=2 Tax=Clostridium argentinense TaxID=29341 RepID=A0A0C1TZH1_9CLOT|nr:HD domain-containing phosphohydrolase [Clostridium argentinense]ARC83089.1 HDIG domain-containing protein [Clostridium argentinense]KIE44693.1 hypothetical protein U732_56 [Clostridium argentinense CDC 2741]NFF41359.1 HD domain-containing protein [Clostridium argentinense]NFP51746.1 HD domain-containing protein [Clostridium argentinense]NFP74284.1 HD domain-containing protein [Clostridium argentinense]